MNKQDKLYFSILNLIEIAQDSMKNIDRLSKSSIDVAKQFGTVKIGTSRGSGHTSCMIRLINEYFHNAMVMFPNLAISRNTNLPYRIGNNINICTPQSMDRIYGCNFDIVIVDCVSLISQSKLDQLYTITCPVMKNPLYLLLE